MVEQVLSTCFSSCLASAEAGAKQSQSQSQIPISPPTPPSPTSTRALLDEMVGWMHRSAFGSCPWQALVCGTRHRDHRSSSRTCRRMAGDLARQPWRPRSVAPGTANQGVHRFDSVGAGPHAGRGQRRCSDPTCMRNNTCGWPSRSFTEHQTHRAPEPRLPGDTEPTKRKRRGANAVSSRSRTADASLLGCCCEGDRVNRAGRKLGHGRHHLSAAEFGSAT
jgi:hypothetical protein